MGFILMLITIIGLIATLILLLVAVITGKKWLRNAMIISSFVWILLYAALLIGFSLRSQQTYLPNNQTKAFCGFYFECHIKASVSGVRTAKEIGSVKAQGTFYIVKMKISNDAKRESLALIAPEATMIDEGPRLYSRIENAEKQLPDGANVHFNQTILAGGSFEKEIVFDLTEPAEDLSLSFTDTHGIDRFIETFLIDDEDSLFHEPMLFIIKMDTSTKPNYEKL